MTELSPAEIAQGVGRGMYERDFAARRAGIELLEISVGAARMGMLVAEDMVNAHAICHGGYIFALADTAFAYACNSYNRVSVAQHCAISYLTSARAGERLLANAREVALRGRSGIYDVSVRTQAGVLIAEFRGHSRRLEGKIAAELPMVEEAASGG